MTIRLILRPSLKPIKARSNNRGLLDCRRRRALTLVEVLVVIAIVGVLLMFLFPATRTSREAARRNQCMNNFKQLTIALQNHHDTRKALPLASTSPLITDDGIQEFGAVGTASPSAEGPTNWTAGQQGDGYSWIVRCLPYMEETALYDKMTSAKDKPIVRYGKLADAAFAPSSNLQLEATATNQSRFFWSMRMPGLVCPSFPGEDDVAAFGDIPTSRVAAGNYVALAATHYRSSPSNHLESGLPNAVGPDAGGRDCSKGAYCGNSGLPFPGVVGGKVQRTGLSHFSKGTSEIALITESREENLTSWYSGLASYVVATLPPPNGATPGGVRVNDPQFEFTWTCTDIANCETALNRGDVKGNTSRYYQPISPHGGGPRIWGPSSRHPGVVIHGFADAHVEGINDNIDKNVYLNMVLR